MGNMGHPCVMFKGKGSTIFVVLHNITVEGVGEHEPISVETLLEVTLVSDVFIPVLTLSVLNVSSFLSCILCDRQLLVLFVAVAAPDCVLFVYPYDCIRHCPPLTLICLFAPDDTTHLGNGKIADVGKLDDASDAMGIQWEERV